MSVLYHEKEVIFLPQKGVIFKLENKDGYHFFL